MLSILLAGASALVWGTGDFLGGKAVQQGAGGQSSGSGLALSVTVVSQLCAIPMVVLFLLIVPGQPGVSAFVWGGIAGVAGLFGIVFLYLGLSTGAMSVVAPTTAVTGAVVPMVGGLLQGERPGAIALVGASCAIFAIALVSTGSPSHGERVRPRVIALALTSGALFGIFFLLLAHAGAGAGMWPLAAARIATIPLGLLLLLPFGGSLRIPRGILPITAAAGVLDLSANGLYLIAVNHGQISILAPIAALYPASTVLLAMWLHKERLKPLQVVGLGLAGAALVLAAS